MEVQHERCSGLDVHKDTVVACVRVAEGGKVRRETRTFGTMTRDLLALVDWLQEQRVTHVAMEATGVYWKPVWHILAGFFELILANAAHIKNVPGRKTDVKDAEWIADLLAHGLIRASFVPPEEIQSLRGLTRTRKQLVQERSQHVHRIQKTLQDANIKIDSVITDLMGKSGTAFLEALIAGETNPDELVKLADRRLKASREEIMEALRGYVTEHHRFLLKLHLDLIRQLDAAILRVETEVAALLEPFRADIDLLVTMPGVSDVAAQVILAEIGADMTRFQTASHLISWAGLCPRNDESAGKRRSTRIRHGAPWLKETLVQVAWAAARTKGSRFQALFQRIRARQGAKKAIIAVAAEVLRCAWHMLTRREPYAHLEAKVLEPMDRERQAQQLVTRLRNLGYNAELSAAA